MTVSLGAIRVPALHAAPSLAVFLLVALAWVVTPASAFCGSETAKGNEGSTCHPRITSDALGFLRPWVLEQVTAHINDPDGWFIDARSTDHFDDCAFRGSIARINGRYVLDPGPGFSGVVPALSPLRRVSGFGPSSTVSDYPQIRQAMKSWAWLLHGAQDFYSHANWIEMGLTDPARHLFRAGLSQWEKLPANWSILRDDVMVSESNVLPEGWKVDLPTGSRIPLVTRADGRRFRLLISGQTPTPFDSCSNFALIPHDNGNRGLNKDNAQRPGHEEAVAMARAQTRHEWCRLLRLTWDTNGAAGAAVLMGLLVDPTQSPHPENTPCAAGAQGPVEVTIRVSRIRVLNDKEDDGPGQLRFVFTLFTEDFRHSVRVQTGEVRVNSNELVPTAGLPRPLTLCLQPTRRVVATVQAWEDDGETGRGELSGEDDLLNGVTRRMGTAADLRRVSATTSFTRRSDNGNKRDLEVTFQVVRSQATAACPGEFATPKR
jgi:hypothetical protein